MMRAALNFVLLFSVLYGDWWATVFFSSLFAFLFPYPVELFLAGLWVDLVYGGAWFRQDLLPFATIGALVLFGLSLFVHRFLLTRFHVRVLFKKQQRFFRD